ncbi:molybdenum cofactor sulfurtransferase [Apostasia shenzhenica]|uniref:Molybdenum cofactor sulfurtransferase n=1 Tax=Apostasia shenzhenica TaxID=1088818 RepID=A0A2I0B2N6_9ASPA|nr:molybdenum cofactor sulfurtransferase [Apostasia shenzhenica]
MGRNVEEEIVLHHNPEAKEEDGDEEPTFNLIPKSLLPSTRPNSMVVKKVCPRQLIPAHIIAEAISTLHGLDLRWSGPITPGEMQYVEQYVLAKYPQYSHGLIEESDKDDLYSIYCSHAESPDSGRRRSPLGTRDPSPSPSLGRSHPELDGAQLEPSRLLDILTKKSSFPGSFISIPEIQARNRTLQHCGLSDEEYLVLFVPSHKDAMMLVGESYPFFRYNYYMTVIGEDVDYVREFAAYKDSKVVAAPPEWLDLRIKGSQLSQQFRRKCKYNPKGLFAYPAARSSMHWVSEARRNSWHVLLDATAIAVGQERLNLALHRPDFVLCTVDNTHAQPSKVTGLLVRRKSFDTSSSPPPPHQA